MGYVVHVNTVNRNIRHGTAQARPGDHRDRKMIKVISIGGLRRMAIRSKWYRESMLERIV